MALVIGHMERCGFGLICLKSEIIEIVNKLQSAAL